MTDKDTSTRSFMPQDRLTRVCDAMLGAFQQHAETAEGDRAIVFLKGKDNHAGIGMSGYDGDDAGAMADLIIHLRAIFRANGKDLHIIPIGITPPESAG
jgi:hypothetical protein